MSCACGCARVCVCVRECAHFFFHGHSNGKDRYCTRSDRNGTRKVATRLTADDLLGRGGVCP